jgi:hypothetical protein
MHTLIRMAFSGGRSEHYGFSFDFASLTKVWFWILNSFSSGADCMSSQPKRDLAFVRLGRVLI